MRLSTIIIGDVARPRPAQRLRNELSSYTHRRSSVTWRLERDLTGYAVHQDLAACDDRDDG